MGVAALSLTAIIAATRARSALPRFAAWSFVAASAFSTAIRASAMAASASCRLEAQVEATRALVSSG